MKKLFSILFLLPALATIAQEDTVALVKEKAPGIAAINLMDGINVKKLFYRIDKGNVYLLNAPIKNPQSIEIKNYNSYHAAISMKDLQIKKVTPNNKNTALKEALIGLGASAVIGAHIGFPGSDRSLTPSINTIFYNQAPGIQNFQRVTALNKASNRANLDVITGTLTGIIIEALINKH